MTLQGKITANIALRPKKHAVTGVMTDLIQTNTFGILVLVTEKMPYPAILRILLEHRSKNRKLDVPGTESHEPERVLLFPRKTGGHSIFSSPMAIKSCKTPTARLPSSLLRV